jgi:preprotein translocase subunit SecA
MTATATTAANEIHQQYGRRVVPIPPNRPSVRVDHDDRVFARRKDKDAAVIAEIQSAHDVGRPVLVGTASVSESERLGSLLAREDIPHAVLNARNDEAEARIIADAGRPGAVTISTNMAGRGTDIRLGGHDEIDRDLVVDAGGLLVIGTNRHESVRIDNQLRGRAGRQGDPGSSRFFVSLDDPLMVRYGIERLIPQGLRSETFKPKIDHPAIRREVDRIQRIAEGQNAEIRTTLTRYSELVEKQRRTVAEWRHSILVQTSTDASASRSAGLSRDRIHQQVLLNFIDEVWCEHLALAASVREGIHLVGVGGLDPLHEFHKQIASAFADVHQQVETRVDHTMDHYDRTGALPSDDLLSGPTSTWTYLVNDRVMSDLQSALFGHGSGAFAAAAVLMTWPVLLLWGIRARWTARREEDRSDG